MLGRREDRLLPRDLSNMLDPNSLMFLDPTEISSTHTLNLTIAASSEDNRSQGCPLFNDAIDDHHFSAAGSEVWADSVGRRLVLLLEQAKKRTREERSHDRSSRGAADIGRAGSTSSSLGGTDTSEARSTQLLDIADPACG